MSHGAGVQEQSRRKLAVAFCLRPHHGAALPLAPAIPGDSRVCVVVLLKSARIYNFKGISRGNRRFRSTN
jgi:hypothetical protein